MRSIDLKSSEDTVAGQSKSAQLLSDYWDIQLALSEAWSLSGSGDFEKSNTIFADLRNLDLDRIAEELLEDLYSKAARNLIAQEKVTEALNVVREGCERIGPSKGVLLWNAKASYASISGTEAEAKKSLQDLEAAVSQRADVLRQPRFLPATRDAELTKLNFVKWHLDVVRARIEFRFGDKSKSAELLRDALNTQMSLPVDSRMEALMLLTRSLLTRRNLGPSCRTLEDAIALDPKNKALRRRASDAWQQAGVIGRSQEQLGFSDDGSYQSALALLQAAVVAEDSTPTERQDPGRVELWMDEAESRRKSETEQGKEPPLSWVLDVMRWERKKNAARFNDVSSDPKSEDDLLELARRYPQVAQLQAIAAMTLMGSGKESEAQVALANLSTLKEKGASLVVGSATAFSVES